MDIFSSTRFPDEIGKWIVEYSNITSIAFEDYQTFSQNLKEMGFSERDGLSCSERIISPLYSGMLKKNNPNSRVFEIDFVNWDKYYDFKEKNLIHPAINKPFDPQKPDYLFPEKRNEFISSLCSVSRGVDQQKFLKKFNLSSNRFFYIDYHGDANNKNTSEKCWCLGGSENIHFLTLLSVEVVCSINSYIGLIVFNFAEFDYMNDSTKILPFDKNKLAPLNEHTIADALNFALFRNIRSEYIHRHQFKENPIRYKEGNYFPLSYSSENTKKNYYSGIADNGLLEETFEGFYGVIPSILSDEECEAALNLKDISIEEYINKKTSEFFGKVEEFVNKDKELSIEESSDEFFELFDRFAINTNIFDNSIVLDDVIKEICQKCKASFYRSDITESVNNSFLGDSNVTLMNFAKRDNSLNSASLHPEESSYVVPMVFLNGKVVVSSLQGNNSPYICNLYPKKRTYVVFNKKNALELSRLKISDIFCIEQYISLSLRYYRLYMIKSSAQTNSFDDEMEVFNRQYAEFNNIDLRIRKQPFSNYMEINDLYNVLLRKTAPYDEMEDIHSFFKLRIDSLDKQYQIEKNEKTNKTNTVLTLISILGISSAVKSIADLIHDTWVHSPNPNGRFWIWAFGFSTVLILGSIVYLIYNIIKRK